METVFLLSQADQALGELKGIGRRLPDPNLLINPFIRREAVSSSRIEGTVTGFEQLVLFEVNQERGEEFADHQEVANYIGAMRFGLEQIKQGWPINRKLISEVHWHLMQGVRGKDKSPGQFREVPNLIGGSSWNPASARFVPPPVHELVLLRQFRVAFPQVSKAEQLAAHGISSFQVDGVVLPGFGNHPDHHQGR